MDTMKVAKPIALLSAVLSLLFAPSPSESTSTLGTNKVCATGTCCRQPGSICNDGSPGDAVDKYYLTQGSCGS